MKTFWLCVIVLWGALLTACNSPTPATDRSALEADRSASVVEKSGWIGAWAAAPYGPYPLGPLTGTAPVDPLAVPTTLQGTTASNQSFRMFVHPTIGGDTARVRLSNLMGDRPVTFDSVNIALRAAPPAIVPGSQVMLSFGGQPQIMIAAGDEAISDAVPFHFANGDTLAISFHIVGDSGPMTWHAVSFGQNFVGLPGTGDTTSDPTGLKFTQATTGWFFLSGVDVLAPASPGTIVMLGDSITDGAYEVPESNTRWPDFFAQRLAAESIAMGVLNQGINSNTVTEAGSPPGTGAKGPAAVLRFQRDVLQRSGVRSLVIFEGTNDLSVDIKAQAIYADIRSLADRAHAAGLCVVVATIMPRTNTPAAPWNAATQDPQRQALNNLLLTDTSFDAIADFAKVMGSPLDANMPNPLLYFADQLHPNSLGFMVLANAVPLEALVPPPMGKCTR